MFGKPAETGNFAYQSNSLTDDGVVVELSDAVAARSVSNDTKLSPAVWATHVYFAFPAEFFRLFK